MTFTAVDKDGNEIDLKNPPNPGDVFHAMFGWLNKEQQAYLKQHGFKFGGASGWGGGGSSNSKYKNTGGQGRIGSSACFITYPETDNELEANNLQRIMKQMPEISRDEYNNDIRRLNEKIHMLESELSNSTKGLWLYFVFLSMFVFALLVVVMTGRW